MSYRQNFRGRQDNRFRYSGNNSNRGGGGRGGFNNRQNSGVGGFLSERRETFPQRDRQQNQKPNVNNQKSTPAVTGVKAEPTVSPAQKQKEETKPLMDKKVEKPETPTIAKGNHVESKPNTATIGISDPSPPKKPVAVAVTPDVTKSAERERPTAQKRPNSGYQDQQNRGSSNQGANNEHGKRHAGSDRGRFDSRNNQERKSRFTSPTGHGGPGHGQGNPGYGQGHFSHEEEQFQQPTHVPHPEFGDDLMTEVKVEKKFTGRCRLFIGNLPNETTDDHFKKMFDKFGEINEVFLNKQKMFGFIRLDTRLNAETAKKEMDGATFKGRVIRVRFAAHGAALKVKNIPPMVSNELLEEAFSNFGEVERAIVIVDERGKSTGEGIVEFARKPAAQAAIKKIKEGVFLLTASVHPIAVEPLEQKNDEDGLPEKNVPKNQVYYQEREAPVRFAQRNSFELEWGQRLKQQTLDEEKQRAELEEKFVRDRATMMQEIELARHDYHTMQMKQELLHRQKELERLEEQRKNLEARHHGLQRQREEQYASQGGMMGMGMGGGDQASMLRQQELQQQQMQQQQNMELQQQQQAMRSEEAGRRDGGLLGDVAVYIVAGNDGGQDRFASGGGNLGMQRPPIPPSDMMDLEDAEEGMMGQNRDNMQNQRQSRFDVGPGAGGGFNANSRGSLAGVAAALSQQEGLMGANFGGMQGAGGMGAGNNPRPLMEEMGQEMMADFPKRARHF